MRSNLSTDEIISALRPGLKTGMENDIAWSEIGSGFRETGGTLPPRILRINPGLIYKEWVQNQALNLKSK